MVIGGIDRKTTESMRRKMKRRHDRLSGQSKALQVFIVCIF